MHASAREKIQRETKVIMKFLGILIIEIKPYHSIA